MQKPNCVQYLYDKSIGIELILCNNSLISYPLHNHVSVFTIGLILCGSVLLTIGGNSFICEKDNPFIILPYVPHIIEAKTPYSLITLCINKNILIKCNKNEIQNSIRNLLTAVSDLNITEKQTYQLMNCLDLFNDNSYSSISEPFIDLAKYRLECYPEKKLSIDEMAYSAYMSKYHFIRNFKQIVGLTPHQFQIQNRIRKAQHMLNNIDSITEVALATGFCDQSHFIKQFEKYVGLTPATYKTSCRILA
ncbi:MAG: helix-turn-helix transcriptional regulator [Lachnospiraceae bacterium]|nr:helix-turn-helix transcriptional regulator [Lachnospiraceae bacterium]